MDKCFRLLVKQTYMKRAYLANLENQYEMNYVMYIMQSSGLKDIYIGANNIIKRSKFIYIYKYFLNNTKQKLIHENTYTLLNK